VATEPRIAIVGGDEALATEALVWMLTSAGNRVVGTYPSARGLRAASRARDSKLRLHAAIVDADDPAAGPAAVAELRRAYPELKLLLLCETASPAAVRCAIEQHAEGVVLKSDTSEEAGIALRHVLEGRAVMPAGWQAASLRSEPQGPLAALSVREREVLDLAATGMSNGEIAKRLMISANTVKFHLRTVYARLGVHNRIQATAARRAQPHPGGAGNDSRAGKPDRQLE
jgi:DNA-binding NarL/FixJ family response regulator